MNLTDLSGDDPLTNMAMSVMWCNSLWFAYWCYTMDAYKMGVHAWGYPHFKDSEHA